MKTYNLLMLLLIGVITVSGCTSQSAGNTIPNKNPGFAQQQQTAPTQPTSNTGVTNKDSDTTRPQQSTSTKEAPPGEVKEFTMTAKQWEFEPSTITVNKGDTVKLHITSVDVTHGFGLPEFGVNENLEPGKAVDVDFVADKTGTFTFFCSVYCGGGHSHMKGQLIVK